jgi:hypothetical protein
MRTSHPTVSQLCMPPAFTLVSCLAYSSILKMEAICSSETSVDFQRTIQRYIPEDSTLNMHCVRPQILHRQDSGCWGLDSRQAPLEWSHKRYSFNQLARWIYFSTLIHSVKESRILGRQHYSHFYPHPLFSSREGTSLCVSVSAKK